MAPLLVAIVIPIAAYDRPSLATQVKCVQSQAALRQRTSEALTGRFARRWESPWQQGEDTLSRTGQWQDEAIDGSTIAAPRGQQLLVKLRAVAQQRRSDAARAAADAGWRDSIQDSVFEVATEYLRFVAEIRVADEYALIGTNLQQVTNDAPLLMALRRRFGPSALLLQVTRRVRSLAVSDAPPRAPPTLTMEHRWALWRLFRAAVRTQLAADETLRKRRDALEWRALRRLHAHAIEEQRREARPLLRPLLGRVSPTALYSTSRPSPPQTQQPPQPLAVRSRSESSVGAVGAVSSVSSGSATGIQGAPSLSLPGLPEGYKLAEDWKPPPGFKNYGDDDELPLPPLDGSGDGGDGDDIDSFDESFDDDAGAAHAEPSAATTAAATMAMPAPPPVYLCSWPPSKVDVSSVAMIRAELERLEQQPLADGMGTGARGKVSKADLVKQLLMLCKPKRGSSLSSRSKSSSGGDGGGGGGGGGGRGRPRSS